MRCVIQERTEWVGEEGQGNHRHGAEERAANGASSMRGRRGDGGGDWGRRTGGVNATWGDEPSAASIGEKDPARIERAREGFQTGAGLGSSYGLINLINVRVGTKEK